MQRPVMDKPDISEKGMSRAGEVISSDTRLFMQLQVWGDCADTAAVVNALKSANIDAAVYADINDPRGVAVLTFDTDPAHFLDRVRPLFSSAPFTTMTHKPEYTMMGRSYSIGYEPNLEEVLVDRPRQRVLNPEWPWCIWYPIKRSGRFQQLSDEEQKATLKEHGGIGMAWGAADYVHDIRLACHGLDKNDSDFVLGLVGKELFPLSAIIQRMRSTVQTSQYLERLGPFFIGKVIWQSERGG